MTFEEWFYSWVTKPLTCDVCGKRKVRTQVQGKERPGHIQQSYTLLMCPDDCRKAVAA